MKLNNIGETVEGTITAFKTEGFKIANTSHMMEILSKRLYSNPELAVCRELVCNALDAQASLLHRKQAEDAQAAVNSLQPVEVTLPSWSSDYRFIVKDYGTGLSEEDVMNLYTTYGVSTKQSSNDYIGCLGIGSKSPFAVTEEFSVVSRYCGKATTYHCYKQQGMLVCTKISEVATDEHNGLTVTVPFTEEAADSFVRHSLKFFKGVNKGIVTVNTDACIEFFEDFVGNLKYTFKDMTLYAIEGYTSDNFVRMGQVLYKIPDAWRRDSCSNSYRNVLDVPIGTFTISASRESIEENDTNKSLYLDIIRQIQEDYYQTFLCPLLKTAKTYHTYKKLLSHNDLFNFREVIRDAYKQRKMSLDNSVGYVTSFSIDLRKESIRRYNNAFVCRNNSDTLIAIKEDEAPVIAYGSLLKKWINTQTDINKTYVLLPKEQKERFSELFIPYFSFDGVVFTSDLNKRYLTLKALQKRRMKTSKTVVKNDNFAVYHFGKDFTIRYRKWFNDVKDLDVVPYVVLKEFQCLNTEDEKLIWKAYDFNVKCYGISQVNAKHLPGNFVPLKQYMEEHAQVFADKEYRDRRSIAMFLLKDSKRHKQYCSEAKKELLQKDVWLVESASIFGKQLEGYQARSFGDRLLLQLLDKVERYKKFLTEVEPWFNICSYGMAPAEVKSYVRKLFEEMVISSASITTNKRKDNE